ncbi:MAG: heme-binding domain-containing protein [Bryobacteraceae bacterium]
MRLATVKKWLLGAVAFTGILFGATLLSPAPPLSRVSRFDPDPSVDAILHRSCADCHSQETRWPWYSRLPIASSVIQEDVQEGRSRLDLSSQAPLSASQKEELLDAIVAGSMPPRNYLRLHPGAKLSKEELKRLEAWKVSAASATDQSALKQPQREGRHTVR